MPDPSVPAARSAWRRLVLRSLTVVLATAAVGLAATDTVESFSHTGEKRSFEGIANFGQMNDRLWRGAQPDLEGFEALRARGVDIVVSFTLSGEAMDAEEREVERLGMRFVALPWSTQAVPTPGEVATFLTLVRQNPGRRIFVHCKRGADRTGVMVALYRLTFDHWTVDAALSEMAAFHYYRIFLPHLAAFVRAYGVGGGAARPPS